MAEWESVEKWQKFSKGSWVVVGVSVAEKMSKKEKKKDFWRNKIVQITHHDPNFGVDVTHLTTSM